MKYGGVGDIEPDSLFELELLLKEGMKNILLGWFCLLLLSGCHSNKICLEGKFENMSADDILQITLAYTDSCRWEIPMDEQGNFSFRQKIPLGHLYTVCLPDGKGRIPFYADCQKYKLKQEGNRYFFQVSDSLSKQYALVEFLKGKYCLEQEYEEICQGYDTISDIQQKADRSALLAEKFDEIENYRLKWIKVFAGTEIAQYIICDVLFFYENDYNAFSKAIEALGDFIPEGKMKSRIFTAYERLKAEQLTGEAPDFSLPDKIGKTISLSDFRGKYVLVDFWASWCAPCREKNRQLNKYYAHLKEQDLEIISISLDDNREQWLNAIREDNIQWIQLIDLDGFKKSRVRKDYKISQVPTVYLINPQGVIIQKNPTKEEIIELLQNDMK